MTLSENPFLCLCRLNFPDASVVFENIEAFRFVAGGDVSSVSDFRDFEQLDAEEGIQLVDANGVAEEDVEVVVKFGYSVDVLGARRNTRCILDFNLPRRRTVYR